jgi:predicted GNAT family acetyltransferase
MARLSQVDEQQIINEIKQYINKDCNIIDALVYYADKSGMEVELLGEIIKRSPTLKAKVQQIAENLNMMDKTERISA